MTLGVTIGMLTFASPQSFGSNVVLLSPPPLEVPLTEVVGVEESLPLDEPVPSVIGVVVIVIDPMPVMFMVVESLPDSLPSSPHPNRPSATTLKNNVLRFIS